MDTLSDASVPSYPFRGKCALLARLKNIVCPIFFVRLMIITALVVSSAYSKVFACENIPGTYQTVSESEWAITLEFRATGQVIIVYEEWEPGEYDTRGQSRLSYPWSCADDIVKIQRTDVTEVMQYSDLTSLASLGFQGKAIPGLVGSCVSSLCQYKDMHFWKLSSLMNGAY